MDAAAETRAAILRSARTLFLASGYSSVTVSQIAAAAGVAVQTVYSSAGGKTAILAALLAPAMHDPIVGEVLDSVVAATDPRTVVDVTAAGIRQAHERHWDILFGLLHGGLGEPAAMEVHDEGIQAFVAALAKVADRLVALEALRPEVDHTLAVDLLWFYLGQRSWFLLVGERGWDFDRAEQWLAGSARQALLRDPEARGSACAR
jgi:AcrR family transcriptional regulator